MLKADRYGLLFWCPAAARICRRCLTLHRAGNCRGWNLRWLISNGASDAYALERAKRAGVPTLVIERRGEKRETFTRLLCEALQAEQIDLVVFAGFMVILSRNFLKCLKTAR